MANLSKNTNTKINNENLTKIKGTQMRKMSKQAFQKTPLQLHALAFQQFGSVMARLSCKT